MPELPEVETVRRALERTIKGRSIESVAVFHPRMIQGDLEHFRNLVEGRRIERLSRRGKYLLFILGEVAMLSHLRMEGKYYLKPAGTPPEKHEHVVFTFTDGWALHYHDVRKFGTFEAVPMHSLEDVPALKKLGPEPAELDLRDDVTEIFRGERPIKAILLDQTRLAGIGNIYADEILHCARIHPERPGRTLGVRLRRRVIDCAQRILAAAVQAGGSSVRSYRNTLGEDGRFERSLRVHTHEGKPCPDCQSTIRKAQISGRGTYYCPTCQRRKKG